FVALGVVCGLLWIQSRLNGFWREVFFLTVCLLSVLMLPIQLPLFSMLGSLGGYTVLALSLYAMMRLFMMMDRVPWYSNLTWMAQGVLIIFLVQRGFVPVEVGYFLLCAFVGTIAVSQTVKVYFGQPILGDFAAPLAGFCLGYFWIFMMAKGYYGTPPVLYSYSATEVILSTICSWVVARRFCVPLTPFFIEQAFDTGINPKKLIHTLFLILILLSFFGLANLNASQWGSIVFVTALILFITCYQFKRWAVPRVRFRDLGSDLKQGFSELKKEMMYIPLKKNPPRKKGRKK
ncbi:MAG: hypothetical protein SPL08_00960, partial [Pseudomonadota bacterium]|nr:hypothetical protein [Pseudomonadota bacterium]